MSEELSFSEGALVVTSISPPNSVLKSLAKGCSEHGAHFILIGDIKSPEKFKLDGCNYYSVSKQKRSNLRYATVCRTGSYARKNLGYLLAIQSGAKFIAETDDDNYPMDQFWCKRSERVSGDFIEAKGWFNAYAHFANDFIYPRGFPLELARAKNSGLALSRTVCDKSSLIQQGLADGNPDVDAVYRMLFALPFQFKKSTTLILSKNTWCPFNSQNTTFFYNAYPLLYLPTFCSFRMTDIWRSFVAQRLLWTLDSGLSFHSPTVFQERNEHNLLHDFEEEIPGYLNNMKIVEMLDKIKLVSGPDALINNMIVCYERLCSLKLVGVGELDLLEKWLFDLATSWKPRSK